MRSARRSSHLKSTQSLLSNRRKLDWIGEKLNIQQQHDWYSKSGSNLKQYGGTSLLEQYDGSYVKTIQTLYPEYRWHTLLFKCVPVSAWKQKSEVRDLVDWFGEQFGISTQEDWYSITGDDIKSIKDVGASFLQHYGFSLFRALKQVYPEYTWNDSTDTAFLSKPNYRSILDSVSNELQVNTQEDWYQLSPKDVLGVPGGQKLLQQYEGSLFEAVKAIYSEYLWNPLLFVSINSSVLQQHQNQRKLFNWIAEQLGIETQAQWYSLSGSDVQRHGGSKILELYNKSLSTALQTIYPEFLWSPLLFKHTPLTITQRSHRELMDWISDQLGIATAADWCTMNCTDVKSVGGRYLMELYDNSLWKALNTVYPEFEWLFVPSMDYRSFWKSTEHQRKYLDYLGEQLGIETHDDWYRVCSKDLKHVGGISLLQRYDYSLIKTLSSIYAEYEWNTMLFSFVPRHFWSDLNNQRKLFDWFGTQLGIEVQEDWYRITRENLQSIGSISILEYHNNSILKTLQSVYPEFQWNPLLSKHRATDTKYKRHLLDNIADWWDIEHQQDWYQLITDKMDTIGGSSWPLTALKMAYPEFSWPSLKKEVPQLMLATTWKEHRDPTGYWMSEKFDGCRALWNGKTLVSRLGHTFDAPEWFTKDFPKDLLLDGELWMGRGQFNNLSTLVRSKPTNDSLWNQVVYKVFDTPTMKDQHFEERMNYLEEYLSKNPSPFIDLVKQEKCQGFQHLRDRLTEVESMGGEGLMLRAAMSLYEPKRSQSMLKVKTFLDAEARVIVHIPPANKAVAVGEVMGSMLCELDDGTTFTLSRGITSELRKNPPPVGSLITFRYTPSNFKLPRFPVYVRERTIS